MLSNLSKLFRGLELSIGSWWPEKLNWDVLRRVYVLMVCKGESNIGVNVSLVVSNKYGACKGSFEGGIVGIFQSKLV